LVEALPPRRADEDGVRGPEDGGDGRHEGDPDDRVDEGAHGRRLRERPDEVVEGEVAALVEERQPERAERRVDEADGQEDERRGEEPRELPVVAPPLGRLVDEEDQQSDDHGEHRQAHQELQDLADQIRGGHRVTRFLRRRRGGSGPGPCVETRTGAGLRNSPAPGSERSVDQLEGQLASIVSSTVCVDWPPTQATMPFQNESAPTAPGMRSEPSKRNVVSGSCRISIDWVSSSLEATFGWRPLFAEMTPPRLTRLFAHVSLDR